MMTLMLSALTMFASDSDWGVAKEGVATQLTLMSKEPRVGSAIKLKLDARNADGMARGYDDQQAAVNNSLNQTILLALLLVLPSSQCAYFPTATGTEPKRTVSARSGFSDGGIRCHER